MGCYPPVDHATPAFRYAQSQMETEHMQHTLLPDSYEVSVGSLRNGELGACGQTNNKLTASQTGRSFRAIRSQLDDRC